MWILLIVAAVILLFAVLLVRTYRFAGVPARAGAALSVPSGLAAAEKLSEAVKCATVSNYETEKTDWASFLSFQKLLERQFPLVHSAFEKTVISGYSLIYRWPCPKPDPSKKPALIMAHMDVVPIDPSTRTEWEKEPFSGAIEDGIVWGRGTLDVKIHLIAALEAAERLLSSGFTPDRDIYFAFGHDEELMGNDGAIKICEYFVKQGLRFDFVLDEGLCVMDNVLSGVKKPIAMIGVGEKGYANVLITAEKSGGHSSMPERHSSLGVIAQAICRVEKKPCRPRLIAPVRKFLLAVGPEMSFTNRLILSNLWLFKPLFMAIFSRTSSGGAMLRTTTAVTMAQGSPAPNVLPQKSQACLNSRVLPGETLTDLEAHLKKVLRGLPVHIEFLQSNNPSAVSSSDSASFRLIGSLVGELYPDAIVTPFLVLAATDARKYEPVCENIYRFTPYRIDNSELKKLHGVNENISVDNVNRCVGFFTALFERC